MRRQQQSQNPQPCFRAYGGKHVRVTRDFLVAGYGRFNFHISIIIEINAARQAHLVFSSGGVVGPCELSPGEVAGRAPALFDLAAQILLPSH
jgi:hypothetical protein